MTRNKTKQYLDLKTDIHDALDEMETACFLLFLFDNKKLAYESMSAYNKKIDCEKTGEVVRTFSESILKRKVWLRIINYEEEKVHKFAFVVVKVKPNFDNEGDVRAIWGKYFNIPKCCIKRYIHQNFPFALQSRVQHPQSLKLKQSLKS